MYIRKVSLRVKQDSVRTLADIYAASIIPVLRDTPGCLYATLMQNVEDHSACSSLTLWRDRQAADAYEKSGLYEKLLASLRHLFRDPSDWSMGFSEDLRLDYAPTPERPAVVGFDDPSHFRERLPPPPRYTHLLVIHSRTDKVGEFRQFFSRNILAMYAPRQGFLDAFLMHRADEHHAFHILSFWDASVHPHAIMDEGTLAGILERCRDVMPTTGSAEPGEKERESWPISVVYRCLASSRFNGGRAAEEGAGGDT